MVTPQLWWKKKEVSTGMEALLRRGVSESIYSVFLWGLWYQCAGCPGAPWSFHCFPAAALIQTLNFRRDERAPWLRNANGGETTWPAPSRSFPHAVRLPPKTKTPPSWNAFSALSYDRLLLVLYSWVSEKISDPGRRLWTMILIRKSRHLILRDRAELSFFKKGCLA